MCQKTWKDKIITKIYLFSELCSLCCEFLDASITLSSNLTNQTTKQMDLVSTPECCRAVVKDRNKNAQRILLIKNVGKRKTLKTRFLF